MISFRYHLVSIVGVFLALAVGIVVGTTALNGPITKDLRHKLDAANNYFHTYQHHLGVLRLTMVALPISFVLSAVAAYLLGGMGPRVAMLYGAITVVTGPTVVLPLLRHTRLERKA